MATLQDLSRDSKPCLRREMYRAAIVTICNAVGLSAGEDLERVLPSPNYLIIKPDLLETLL